jgi:TIR domain
MTDAPDDKRDFFVSFNKADRGWATWIAWVLEEAGYSVFFQDWDFRGSFIEQMHQASLRTERTLVVLSEHYLRSEYARSEAWAALARDPVGREDRVITIKIGPTENFGLFSHFGYLDLTASAEADAERLLIERAKQSIDLTYRSKPATRPHFPGQVPKKPYFPGKPITFLSNSHEDAPWMEALARRLKDECAFQVWWNKWVLGPEKGRHQTMARGLEQVASCVVFIGAKTPSEWLQEKIEHALDLQAQNSDFKFVPVLLPGSNPNVIPEFPSLQTWADFRDGQDQEYAFHVLRQVIRGESVGRWPQSGGITSSFGKFRRYEQKITELSRFRLLGVHEEIIIEFERKILDKWLDDGELS